MRQDADPVAVEWLDRQPRELIWTTAITVFEIRFGLELLAPGRRGDGFKTLSPERWTSKGAFYRSNATPRTRQG